jgi:hypothetical protein
MNTVERIETLWDARDCLYEAVNAIETAVRGTSLEARAKAYLLPALKEAIGSGAEYAPMPSSLYELLDALEHDAYTEVLSEEIQDDEY